MAGFLSLLRAFLWLRWRTLAHLVRPDRRRSTGSKLSAWGEVAGWALLALGVVAAALLLTVGAAIAVPTVVHAGKGRMVVVVAVRVGLLMLTGALVFFSVFQAYRGGAGQAPRLRLLPVSSGRLHMLDLASAAADPWILAIVPGLLVLAGGLAILRPAGALPFLLGVLLLVALLATLSAAVSQAVQLVLRDRRRTMVATLVAFALWMVLVTLPAMMGTGDRDAPAPRPETAAPAAEEEETAAGAAGAPEGAGETAGGPSPEAEGGSARGSAGGSERPTVTVSVTPVPGFPPALQVLPSEAFGLVLAAASAPADEPLALADAWLGVGALALQLAALYGVSLLLWRRLLADPVSSSGSRRAVAVPLPGWGLPGLGPVATAVAWGHVRNALRSVQGKVALAGPVLTVVLLAFVFRSEVAESLPAVEAVRSAAFALAAIAFTLLSQQAFTLNQFASAGTGLTLELLSPLAERDLLVGKAAGGLALFLLALLPALAGAALLARELTPQVWLAAVVAAVGVQALQAPVAAWISMLLPKGVDLDKLGKEGQAHQGAVLLGMLTIGFLVTPAAAVGALALWVWESVAMLLVLEGVVALLSCVLALLLLRSVEAALGRRREALFLAVGDRS